MVIGQEIANGVFLSAVDCESRQYCQLAQFWHQLNVEDVIRLSFGGEDVPRNSRLDSSHVVGACAMGKFKPFLFGTIFGGGVAFVALQYHLVHSNEGFRLIPRTPQPSIGLAYADIRNWGVEEWADRPELARAMVAHGSTDLVATSVSGGLTETISARSSTLDKLRGLMNNAKDEFNDRSSTDSPGFLGIPDDDESPENSQNLFSIPFPQDARKNAAPSTAARNASPERSPTNVARRELPSIEDILGAGANGVQDISRSRPRAVAPENRLSSPQDAAQETQALEDMLFAEDTETVKPKPTAEDSSYGVFEDISSGVRQAAETTLLNRARHGFAEKTRSAVNDTSTSMERYVRDRVQDVLPEPVSSMFRQKAAFPEKNPGPQQRSHAPALPTFEDGYDPFIR